MNKKKNKKKKKKKKTYNKPNRQVDVDLKTMQ